eukprot:TRINITY_DN29340_c0_g1_i1.p2 TRINITY_DN29340_c0_g1~~TRINITY_DN29340_c0_g1_i1.p2  ORF type:complete len:179 (+),score=11.57 TRINITY_DN29340_c0_g1_i1:149-685(+)
MCIRDRYIIFDFGLILWFIIEEHHIGKEKFGVIIVFNLKITSQGHVSYGIGGRRNLQLLLCLLFFLVFCQLFFFVQFFSIKVFFTFNWADDFFSSSISTLPFGRRVEIISLGSGILLVADLQQKQQKWASQSSADLVPTKREISSQLSIPHVLCVDTCLLYTSPSPRDLSTSRMPSSA